MVVAVVATFAIGDAPDKDAITIFFLINHIKAIHMAIFEGAQMLQITQK